MSACGRCALSQDGAERLRDILDRKASALGTRNNQCRSIEEAVQIVVEIFVARLRRFEVI
jgi:hypothetical protein